MAPRPRDAIVALLTLSLLATVRIGWQHAQEVRRLPASRERSRRRRGEVVHHAAGASAAVPSRVSAHRDRQVPKHAQGTFFAQPRGGRFGKSLEALGWTRAARPADAEILWYQRKQLIDWGAVAEWQLVNHVRRERELGHKARLASHLKGTAAERWVPETFDLANATERAAFVAVASREAPPGPEELPRWLFKDPAKDGGTGVEVVAAGAAALDARGALSRDHASKLAQRYVGDLLLLDGRKFDLRVYWAVASFTPPLVLYYGGTLRVSLADFGERGGNRTKAVDLTNAAQQAGGHKSHDERSRQPMGALHALLRAEHAKRPDWPRDPAARVDCEIRRAITAVWRAYADDPGGNALEPRGTHDAFALFGADFLVDANLDVHLSEIQSGPGLPVNTDAVRAVVTKMVPALADVVLAVRDAPYSETPRHKAAIETAEAHGFEVLVDAATPRDPVACGGS